MGNVTDDNGIPSTGSDYQIYEHFSVFSNIFWITIICFSTFFNFCGTLVTLTSNELSTPYFLFLRSMFMANIIATFSTMSYFVKSPCPTGFAPSMWSTAMKFGFSVALASSAAASCERFWKVRHLRNVGSNISIVSARIMICCLWALVLVVVGTEAALNTSIITFAVMVLSFVLALVLSTVTLGKLRDSNVHSASAGIELQRTATLKKSMRLIQAILASTVLFAVFASFRELPKLSNKLSFKCFTALVYRLATLNTIADPLLYFWMTKSARAEIKRLYHKVIRRNPSVGVIAIYQREVTGIAANASGHEIVCISRHNKHIM